MRINFFFIYILQRVSHNKTHARARTHTYTQNEINIYYAYIKNMSYKSFSS